MFDTLNFPSQDKLLLGALVLSGLALLAALGAFLSARKRFRNHLESRLTDIKRAFADAYTGMRDGSIDAQRVRVAEQAIAAIIHDLEDYLK